MKRATAVRHLTEMGEVASELVQQLGGTDIGWPLHEIWVAGALLDDVVELDAGSVVLMLDLAADELPWLALHPAGEWVSEQLRLGKRPMLWCYRPSVRPPWNARHRRVVRVWSAAAGIDEAAIEALRVSGPAAVVAPTVDVLVEQLAVELAASRAHLRRVVDDYWKPGWRRRHGGGAREDHLWRAASAVIEIDDALDELHD